MAVEDAVPDVDEFDRPDLELSPGRHRVQAETAGERGEPYGPDEVEGACKERVANAPDPIEDAEPVEERR